jgi:hypothetical protein
VNLDRSRALLQKLSIKDREKNISVPFIFNPNQAKAHDLTRRAYEKNKWIRNIVLKSRRVGMSSYFDALAFCHCLARAQAHALIVAHLKDVSQKGLFRVPRDLALELNQKTKCCDVRASQIIFNHAAGDSHLDIATAGSVGGGRGLTLTFLHLSEAAQYPGADSFLGMLPAVSKAPDTAVILESTAFGRTGIGQTFYEFWVRANTRPPKWNGFTPIFLSWLQDPACVRDELEAEDAPASDLERELMAKPFSCTRAQVAWMRMVLEGECDGSDQKFAQEYPWCLVGDTRISTEEFGIIPIREARANYTTESGKIKYYSSQGVHEVVKATTAAGREIIGTGNHPMIDENGNLLRLCDSVGKKIRLARPTFSRQYDVVHWCDMVMSEHSITVSPELGRFLGYFMGDGSYSCNVISIACCGLDQDVVRDVEFLFDQFFGAHQTRKTGSKKGCSDVRVTRTGFREYANHLGILREQRGHDRTIRKVCVPPCIWRSPREVVREFLRGLFESDGFNGYGQPRVSLFSKYPEFLRDVQFLLLGFGITSRVKSRKTKNKGMANTLDLRTEESIIFNREIGFISERKNCRKGYQPRWTNHTRRAKIEYLDEVVSIERAGEQEVFDVTIEDMHAFCANGLLSHNTPEVAFIATGDPAFTPQEINYAVSTKAPPINKGKLARSGGKIVLEESRATYPTLIWELPIERAWYYVGVDCSRGIESGDFQAITVYNGSTGDIAARFASNQISIPELAENVDKIGRWYNNAMVIVELTGNLGLWCNNTLRDKYFYPNIYIWKGKDDKVASAARSKSQGWETTSRTRDLLFSTFRGKLRDGMKNLPGGLRPKDEELIRQMDLCTLSGGLRWEVEYGHDDILISSMLAVVAASQYPPPNIMSFTANVMDKDRSSSALSKLRVQPDTTQWLKGDLANIFRGSGSAAMKKRCRETLGVV